MSRINTNVPSLVAARVLSNNQAKLNTALERLSTGLRINSGKDDPAGLIASETLRSDMAATSAAIDNAQRADNMVAVGEGSLQEISSLLVDLQGLVDHSASSAGLSADEVAANQSQIDSILDTINRISTSTEFQGKKLLNGTLDYATSAVAPGATGSSITDLNITGARIPSGGFRSVLVQVTSSAQTAQVIYASASIAAGGATFQFSGKYGTEQLSFAAGTAASAVAASVNQSKALTGVSATVSGTGATARIKFDSTDYGSNAFVTVQAISGSFDVTGGDSSTGDHGVNAGVQINGTSATTDGLDASLRTASLSLDLTLASGFAQQTVNSKTFYITGGGANFSIAPTLGMNALASIGFQNVSTGTLGKASVGFLASLGTGQANQMTSDNSAVAQRVVGEAVKQVSTLRGRLGAFQKNTLASTISALQVALENTTAAESAIRDADFAAETSNLTRAQILVNSSTSVLQLANAAPQSVLSLIRGG